MPGAKTVMHVTIYRVVAAFGLYISKYSRCSITLTQTYQGEIKLCSFGWLNAGTEYSTRFHFIL